MHTWAFTENTLPTCEPRNVAIRLSASYVLRRASSTSTCRLSTSFSLASLASQTLVSGLFLWSCSQATFTDLCVVFRCSIGPFTLGSLFTLWPLKWSRVYLWPLYLIHMSVSCEQFPFMVGCIWISLKAWRGKTAGFHTIKNKHYIKGSVKEVLSF